jgi:hypothetical protein
LWRFDRGSQFLYRADTDAIGLAEGPVDRSGFSHPHLGAVDYGRNIGRIGVAVADESSAVPGLEHHRFENPALRGFVAELEYRVNPNTVTAMSSSHPQQARMCDVPFSL